MFYLNASSTDFENTHEFNPSDLAYPEVLQQRSDCADFVDRLKHLVNAPPNAQVIFNSGATESIANCVFWAKSYFPTGTIWGTTFDHASVKMNCDNIGMKYSQKGMPSDCAALFITQVNPRTGEIFNVTNIARKMLSMHYLIDDTTTYVSEYKFEEDTSETASKPKSSTRDVLMYHPLMFLDASQSLGKVPIDMEKWNLNAVFFSLHKFGGRIGNGVLIISDTKQAPFKPLIAGLQQKGLRGGTYSLENILSFSKSQSESLTA